MNNLKGLIDCHTHTKFSPDSEESPEEMIEAAVRSGLCAYAVTDHCECNRWFEADYYNAEPDEYYSYNFSKSLEESICRITALKEVYRDSIELICGAELGQAEQDFNTAEKIVSNTRLDFVIGSVHELPDKPDFYFIDSSSLEISEIYRLLENYFLEVNKLCRWNGFDVLGHLTYPLRYIEGRDKRTVDISRFDDIIEDSFKRLASSGRGIEINSSGLRDNYKKPFPCEKYIKMFKNAGGEIISLGSDAHKKSDVGKGVARCSEIARECGFRYAAYYKNRKPVFIKL